MGAEDNRASLMDLGFRSMPNQEKKQSFTISGSFGDIACCQSESVIGYVELPNLFIKKINIGVNALD